MADYVTNLDTILTNQAEKEVLVNQLIDAASPSMLYGRHGSACVGLTWAYYGGTFFLPDGSIAEIANGTLTLAASSTNYIEVNPASGAISSNTTGFTAGRTKIYTVTTGVGAVTDYDDHRSFNILPPGTLAQIADARILANISGGLSSPVATTLSALLDYILGNSQGSIVFRGAAAWTLLAPGTAGRFLKTGGAGADPSWDVVAGASGGDVVGPASAVDGHFVQFDLATGKLVKDGGLSFDIDGTLAANSDSRIASQKAVKSYVDNAITGGAADVMIFKGVIDCSANPNYPAADAGHLYKVSVAGKIGGASGADVRAGDTLYCITDGTASGDQATVGANWNIAEENMTSSSFGAFINALTGKTTPVDADYVGLMDSAASNVAKKLSWANIKATLKTYFDALYRPKNPVVSTITYATSVTLDCSTADVFEITLTGNITIDFTGGVNEQKVQVVLKQDGTGSRTVAFGTSVGFGSDLPSFTATTTANKIDYVGVQYNSGATKYHLIAATKGY